MIFLWSSEGNEMLKMHKRMAALSSYSVLLAFSFIPLRRWGSRMKMKMTWSLILNLPFIFFPLPKGVILPVEESAPSSAGPHCLTSQLGRDGPRSLAPAWIREQPSFHLLCAPDPCPSSLRSKRATSRRGTWTQVTATKGGFSSGTPCWLERQRCPLAILPLLPVRLLRWRLVLCPAVFALQPPPSHWGRRRISAPHKYPAPLKLRWNSRRN